jgi:hypothetical protein
MDVSSQFHIPVALFPGKIPGAHWIRAQMGSTAGVDAAGERNLPQARIETRLNDVYHEK